MSKRVSMLTMSLVLASAATARAQSEEIQAAPVSGRTSAQAEAAAEARDDGWNRPYGLLFNLNNIFQVDEILEGYRGLGFGGQFNLDPTSAVRVGLSLTRFSDPVEVVKTTTTVGDEEIVTYELSGTGGPTSEYSVAVSADYLMRFGTDYLAPYAGAGVFVVWSRDATQYTDDVTVPDQIRTVDEAEQNLGFGFIGTLGAEWRLHERFSIYAEYALGVEAVGWHSAHGTETIESTVAGSATAQTKIERSSTRYLNYDLDLFQGASLGLIAHF